MGRDWVCGEMDRKNSMLDPFHFSEGAFGFIVHAQNCYFLNQLKKMVSLALFQLFSGRRET